MSDEKILYEAKRWLSTAADDIDAARIMKNNKKFAHACFLCQQSSEKAIKALYYYLDEDPWGHSIIKLIDEFKNISTDLYKKLIIFNHDARILDRYYIPTRYPNGLPDIIPSEAYSEDDANTGLQIADKIISFIKDEIFKGSSFINSH